MSLRRDFQNLILKLSRDPKLKAAMETIRVNTKPPGAGSGQFESLPGTAWQVLLVSSRFIGKRRARAVADVLDVITFLVTLSLIVKQNVFDRPEVKAFLEKSWNGFSTATRRLLKSVKAAGEAGIRSAGQAIQSQKSGRRLKRPD